MNRKQTALLKALPDLLFEVGFDGKIHDFHSPRTELLAMPPEQFMGRLISEVLPPDAASVCMHALEQASRIGLSSGAVYALDLPVGRRWFELSVSSIPLEGDGDCDQHFICLSRDVTLRMEADKAMRIAATAFETEQGMLITDAHATILKVNKAFCRISGYSESEALGQTPKLLQSGRHGSDFYGRMWQSLRTTGAWQGEVWNRRKDGMEYPEWLSIQAVKNESGVVTNYVASFADISAVKRAEEQIEALAFSDPLTGLPNRRHLIIKLQQTLMDKAPYFWGALLVLDLDNFKALNDKHGHQWGDRLLQQVAERIGACLQADDVLARIGGDSFAVLLKQRADATQPAEFLVMAAAHQIMEGIKFGLHVDGSRVHLTTSLGIAMFSEQGDSQVEEIMVQAETAMHQAKLAGRNTLCVYDASVQEQLNNRVSLEADLRQAIAQNQLHLAFQPQVSTLGGYTGAEALLRWSHTTRGRVPPAEFIPIAEEAGLIVEIGHWVLTTACRQLADWARKPALRDLTLAVNVSALQFNREDFVQSTLDVLAHTGARADRLKLELTESLMISNVDGIIEKMKALQDRGVRFSMDDFGTGFSSLSYLKRLPLNQLKIDQSFVRNIENETHDAAIASMVIALGQSMGLEVIAEGVEKISQRDLLAELGCHSYQGYFFGKPLDIEDFEDLVTAAADTQRTALCD